MGVHLCKASGTGSILFPVKLALWCSAACRLPVLRLLQLHAVHYSDVLQTPSVGLLLVCHLVYACDTAAHIHGRHLLLKVPSLALLYGRRLRSLGMLWYSFRTVWQTGRNLGPCQLGSWQQPHGHCVCKSKSAAQECCTLAAQTLAWRS